MLASSFDQYLIALSQESVRQLISKIDAFPAGQRELQESYLVEILGDLRKLAIYLTLMKRYFHFSESDFCSYTNSDGTLLSILGILKASSQCLKTGDFLGAGTLLTDDLRDNLVQWIMRIPPPAQDLPAQHYGSMNV